MVNRRRLRAVIYPAAVVLDAACAAAACWAGAWAVGAVITAGAAATVAVWQAPRVRAWLLVRRARAQMAAPGGWTDAGPDGPPRAEPAMNPGGASLPAWAEGDDDDD